MSAINRLFMVQSHLEKIPQEKMIPTFPMLPQNDKFVYSPREFYKINPTVRK